MLTAYQLAQRFVIMVKQRQVDAFDPWLTDAQSCSVRDFALSRMGC
jgi:hypothetical protein